MFNTDDIDLVYKNFIENNIECLSGPRYFDFTAQGFGKSKAFYFKDPDGIILEMIQNGRPVNGAAGTEECCKR